MSAQSRYIGNPLFEATSGRQGAPSANAEEYFGAEERDFYGQELYDTSRYIRQNYLEPNYRYSIENSSRATPLTASSLRHHSIDSPDHFVQRRTTRYK